MMNSNRFGVTLNQLQSLIAEGLRCGGDWCDLYFEDTSYNDLLLRDSSVCSGGHHVDYGCGIRVLKGEKTGYAYSENTDYHSLLRAARSAASIASVGSEQAFCADTSSFANTSVSAAQPLLSNAGETSFYRELQPWEQCELGPFSTFLQRIEAGIRARECRAHKVVAVLSWSKSDVMMYNSLGELTCDSRPLGSITVQTIFVQGDKTEQARVSRSLRAGAEMLSEELLQELISESVKDIDQRFEARRPKGGQMSVVMGAGASGILLHEAMGHAFEADFNRKGQSIFADKMGQQICRKGINIVDDGTLDSVRGSINYDDEGVRGQKTYMVSDGSLSSYLHDRISAKYYGVAPTGNGRRESFRYNPIPRMRSTYMENGCDGTLADLIASVKQGVYVDQFANGQVKIGEGDFTFYVKSGYLIESGKLTMPIKDINIIGNGPEALADIVGVASDLKVDLGTWTCGKEQSVSVSCGMPSVLVNRLTIGGE